MSNGNNKNNNEKENKKKIYKLLLLGDQAVGKTSIILRYTKDKIPKNHLTTIGLDYATKTETLKNGTNVTLQIWDTAGQERFNAITKKLYKSSHGLILVYDITRMQSFNNINKWLQTIKEENDENVKLILVGNKSDLENEREVHITEGQELADNFSISFFEISAKDNIGVKEIFLDIAEKLCFDNNIEKEWVQIQKENYSQSGKDKCC